MRFVDFVAQLAGDANVDEAQAVIRREVGSHAARWLATEAGIAPRTARRWLSDAVPASREDVVIAIATALFRAPLAGQVMASSGGGGTVSVGAVEVAYDDTDEGTRSIGDVDIDLEPIAEALKAGDVDYAADAFSSAVLEAYGPGLGDVLQIADYMDGIDLG